MSTYTFTTIVTGRISIDAGTFNVAPESSHVVLTYDKGNRVSISYGSVSLNIDATKDTVVIDGTSRAPNFFTGATLYSALTTLFPKGNAGSAATGLNSDGTYSPDSSAHYINTATSLKNADSLLDAQVFSNSQSITTNNQAISTSNTRTALFLGAMTSTQRDALSSPTVGSLLYNTTTGVMEVYEDATWTWMPAGGMGNTNWNNRYGFDYVRNFMNVNNDAVLAQSTPNSGLIVANQAPTGSTSEAGPICGLYTQTLANGRAAFISSIGTVILGSGLTMVEMRIYLPVLSNSTDRYVFYAGFSNNSAGIDPANGAGIFYDEGGVSAGSTATGNWQLSVSNNNTRTIVATSVAVAATTYYKLRTEINAAGTAVKFFINDVLVNPGGTDITTNIPTGQTRSTGINVFMAKQVGTTSRGAFINALRFRQKYTNSR